MKFQFPEDFVPTEEQLELQFSVNEWKIIQKALIQFALHDLSITPARMAKQIRDELANTKLPPEGSVSVAALIQRFKKAKESPHPFNEPRLQSWIRKSLQ